MYTRVHRKKLHGRKRGRRRCLKGPSVEGSISVTRPEQSKDRTPLAIYTSCLGTYLLSQKRWKAEWHQMACRRRSASNGIAFLNFPHVIHMHTSVDIYIYICIYSQMHIRMQLCMHVYILYIYIQICARYLCLINKYVHWSFKLLNSCCGVVLRAPSRWNCLTLIGQLHWLPVEYMISFRLLYDVTYKS